MPDESTTHASRRESSRRTGACCLIGGSIIVILARIAHGDLPTETGQAALTYVASRPMYALIHLGDVLGFVVWAGGLCALSGSLTNRLACMAGRLGLISVVIGVAVHFTEFSIDGFGLPMLADAWAKAAQADQLNLELQARLVLVAIGGPAVTSLALAWGSTLALYGLAVTKEGYSTWLGWTGVVVGVAIFVLATTFYVKPNIYPGFVLFGLGTLVAHSWTITLGVAMWRRGGGEPFVNNPEMA